jgi:hypothetical protein
MMATERERILAGRLRRQGLAEPLAEAAGYDDLFARLQPVAPIANSRPGDPPRLVHRARFDDGAEADRRRAGREIVKGRFLGGGIGYVRAADLPLYASAFRRPLARLDAVQTAVFEVVQREGPVTPRQIKETTGLLNKTIMPALHRLQEAFLVYEDQVDSDWERGWFDLAAEWPAAAEPEPWEAAAGEALRRFLRAHVFATAEQMRDWSGWPARGLAALLADLERAGAIRPAAIAGLGEGWLDPDADLAEERPSASAFMLHKADPLARSHASELKRRFGDRETLQYLLIDGAFAGAVVGHWRIGPHDVEDIVVELPAAARAARREEIVRAVAWGYAPPRHHILRYDGQELAGM